MAIKIITINKDIKLGNLSSVERDLIFFFLFFVFLFFCFLIIRFFTLNFESTFIERLNNNKQ